MSVFQVRLVAENRNYVSTDGGTTWVPFTGAGSGGTSSNFGAAFPGAGSAAGFYKASDGTMSGASVDDSRYLNVHVQAGGVGGGAMTVADGADVVEGSLADAKVVGDNSGTVSAKLRGLNYLLALVVNTVSGFLRTSTKTALVAVAPTAATVGVASAQAQAATATRAGLVLINTSANTISLGFGAAAVLNSGITLYPGGVYVMDEYTFNAGAVNAIASAAASNLAIQEYTL